MRDWICKLEHSSEQLKAIDLMGECHLGCGERTAHRDVQLSEEAKIVQSKIDKLDDIMLSSGNVAWKTGDDVAGLIGSLKKDERGQLAEAYLRKLNEMVEKEIDIDHLPVWLYNFQGLLKSTDLHVDGIEDKELPIRLISMCVDRYRQAMASCSECSEREAVPDKRKKLEGQVRTMRTDFAIFSEDIRKVYLPLVAARVPSADRYQYWRILLEDKMKTCAPARLTRRTAEKTNSRPCLGTWQ